MDQSIKSFVNNYLEQYDLKSKGEFNVKWTQEKDRDGIAWRHGEEKKLFSPFNEQNL